MYWELKLKDGTSQMIAPNKADVVKRQMQVRGTISTQAREILFSEIESFMMTSKPYETNNRLLDSVAQAFNEPVITEDGVKAAWVKKDVTANEYQKKYSMYRTLGRNGSMVTVAFVLPVHQINKLSVDYCNPSEIARLDG